MLAAVEEASEHRFHASWSITVNAMLKSVIQEALRHCGRRLRGALHSGRDLNGTARKAREMAVCGDVAGAASLVRAALERDPDWAEGLRLLGALHATTGAWELARTAFAQSVALEGTHAGAHVDLGNVLRLMGLHDEAEASYRAALQLAPGMEAALIGLAFALDASGRTDEAIAALSSTNDELPSFEIFRTLVHLLDRHERYNDALALCRRAVAAGAFGAEAHASLGFILLKRKFDPARALEHFERAEFLGGADAELLANRGIALQDLGRLKDAIGSYEASLQLDPANHIAGFHRGLAHLLQGEYARGWEDYELRLLSKDRPQRSFPNPRWDGRAVPGATLLVYAEQGIGDEIMFASCLPDILSRCGHVVLDCAVKLEPIMRRSFPEVTVHGGTQFQDAAWLDELPPIDFVVPIGSLPLLTRQSRSDFPRHAGYLRADSGRTRYFRERMDEVGPGLKVGFSWRGGTGVSRQGIRTLELDQLQPLFDVPGVQFFNLQYDTTQAEAARLPSLSKQVHHLPEALQVYDDTAAFVAALDLVVTVCTAVVHLSGALGRPVWVIAPYSAEWRYGHAGEEMPWYPAASILRQPARGEWEVPLAEATRRLRSLARAP